MLGHFLENMIGRGFALGHGLGLGLLFLHGGSLRTGGGFALGLGLRLRRFLHGGGWLFRGVILRVVLVVLLATVPCIQHRISLLGCRHGGLRLGLVRCTWGSPCG